MNENNTFELSEHFYSVQCEGISTGIPAYFIRLKSCNLACGFSGKAIVKLKRQIDGIEGYIPGGNIVGDLNEQGIATWTCDSAPVWLKGVHTSFKELVNSWSEQGILEWIRTGRIHMIWTGGEPTIPKHQKAISKFLTDFKSLYDASTSYSEIETNGTIYIEEELFNHLNQINCSVKLANSGMEKDRRIVPDALNRIMQHKNYSFKFVVSSENDFKEIINDFVIPFDIPVDKICMMPGLDSQEDYHERTRFVLEMAKKYGYRGLTRLHISAWDRATGV
jgi:7-carboxy-7-deazaguanine synthase